MSHHIDIALRHCYFAHAQWFALFSGMTFNAAQFGDIWLTHWSWMCLFGGMALSTKKKGRETYGEKQP